MVSTAACYPGFLSRQGRVYYQMNLNIGLIYVTVGTKGRSTSMPISAHCLILDKVQGLWSGILTYTSLVLLQMKIKTLLQRKHLIEDNKLT